MNSILNYFQPIQVEPKFPIKYKEKTFEDIEPNERIKLGKTKLKDLFYMRKSFYRKGSKKDVDDFFEIFIDSEILFLISFFEREIPKNEIYYERLGIEFFLIKEKKFIKVFLQVKEILELAGPNIPHIIRGSSGSSLTSYLLGITNINPIEHNISLARFMHEQRNDIPDIDIDFGTNIRDTIYQKIFDHWNGRVARISNHIFYKEKSALKEAIRKNGYHKFIPKDFNLDNIFTDEKVQKKVLEEANELEGIFRCHSLHCGGIVIFDNKVPERYYLKDFTINKEKGKETYGKQIKLNKDEVEDYELIKIDILSNRGLSQLWDIAQIPIENYPYQTETYLYLRNGNNLGITYAESRGLRKIFMLMKPNSIDDIACALALIRPAASANGQKSEFLQNYSNILREVKTNGDYIIYDDDAIQFIQKIIDCSESDADIYRKAFAKNKYHKKQEFLSKLKSKHTDFENEKYDMIMQQLDALQEYSFCKSHAYSYAKLVYALAYQKYNNPKEFWLSTLNNCNSSFRKWVHFREAKKSGIQLTLSSRPYILKNNKLIGKNAISKLKYEDISDYFTHGYWIGNNFLPGMYCTYYNEIPKPTKKNPNPGIVKMANFSGLIATGRTYFPPKNFKKVNSVNLTNNQDVENKEKKQRIITFFTIGYEDGKYLDLVLWGKYPISKLHCIEGKGIVKDEDTCPWIQVTQFRFRFIKNN
jgi:DNA polymerase III alpha subunit